MRMLVSGSSGLAGKAVCTALEREGHSVMRLVRNGTALSENAVYWDPERGILASDQLEGLEGVIHLAGEPIAQGRWTPERKARIRDSRVLGTRLLCERLTACTSPPAFLIAASAIGYYGNCDDEVVAEDHAPGEGFLAEISQAWEGETRRAVDAGLRVVNLRLGMVLSVGGGALAAMLPPFRLGLGGPLGNGAMWMSWVHLDDLVRVVLFSINTPALAGPVNVVAPNPVINRDFAKSLGRALKRPTLLAVPAPVLRIVLGQLADELLLSSVRVRPRRLEEAGFNFNFPNLDAALADLITP